MATPNNNLPFIIYSTPQGGVKIGVAVKDETIWATQKAMAELFGVEVNTINYHLKEIYKSLELLEEATIRKIRIVQTEGNRHLKNIFEENELNEKVVCAFFAHTTQHASFAKWWKKRFPFAPLCCAAMFTRAGKI